LRKEIRLERAIIKRKHTQRSKEVGAVKIHCLREFRNPGVAGADYLLSGRGLRGIRDRLPVRRCTVPRPRESVIVIDHIIMKLLN
jgi:hypothetical protein